MSYIKKLFGNDTMHIEKCYATSTHNIEYCKKDKDFFEFGKPL